MNSSAFDHATSESSDAACTVPLDVAPSTSPPERWTTRLRRHLTIAFAAKLVLLALLYFLFFPSSQRPQLDAGRVANHLLSPR